VKTEATSPKKENSIQIRVDEFIFLPKR